MASACLLVSGPFQRILVRLRFPGGGQYRPQIMWDQRKDAPGSLEQTLQGVASQPFGRFFVEPSARFLGRPARPVADVVVGGGMRDHGIVVLAHSPRPDFPATGMPVLRHAAAPWLQPRAQCVNDGSAVPLGQSLEEVRLVSPSCLMAKSLEGLPQGGQGSWNTERLLSSTFRAPVLLLPMFYYWVESRKQKTLDRLVERGRV